MLRLFSFYALVQDMSSFGDPDGGTGVFRIPSYSSQWMGVAQMRECAVCVAGSVFDFPVDRLGMVTAAKQRWRCVLLVCPRGYFLQRVVRMVKKKGRANKKHRPTISFQMALNKLLTCNLH